MDQFTPLLIHHQEVYDTNLVATKGTQSLIKSDIFTKDNTAEFLMIASKIWTNEKGGGIFENLYYPDSYLKHNFPIYKSTLKRMIKNINIPKIENNSNRYILTGPINACCMKAEKELIENNPKKNIEFWYSAETIYGLENRVLWGINNYKVLQSRLELLQWHRGSLNKKINTYLDNKFIPQVIAYDDLAKKPNITFKCYTTNYLMINALKKIAIQEQESK